MNVLITGANRGIGFELARLCAERGDLVFAGCRRLDQGGVLQALGDKHPGRVVVLPLEISSEESLAECVALVQEQAKAIDLLVNNAAINAGVEDIRTFDARRAMEVLMVNAVSQVMVVQKFLDLLKASQQAKIINVSSESGSVSSMTQFRGYTYFGSKAAFNMFSRCLAWDPEMAGVVTIALHPGWVRTDMGGPNAHLGVNEAGAGIMALTERLTLEDNGKFFTWDGQEYPW